jgi:hypothetical protein
MLALASVKKTYVGLDYWHGTVKGLLVTVGLSQMAQYSLFSALLLTRLCSKVSLVKSSTLYKEKCDIWDVPCMMSKGELFIRIEKNK